MFDPSSKMSTTVGILTFMSRIDVMLSRVKHENSLLPQVLTFFDKSHIDEGVNGVY